MKVLVLGGAASVWDDVAALEALYGKPWDGIVVAANDIGCHWPRQLHHWASLHPYKFPKWRALRSANGHPDGYLTWAREGRWHEKLTDCYLLPWGSGSSGMLAAQVAKTIGATHAVLCGIPMTPTAHFAETTERFASKWQSANNLWHLWERNSRRFDGWMRSMSGVTADHFGRPTADWLV